MSTDDCDASLEGSKRNKSVSEGTEVAHVEEHLV